MLHAVDFESEAIEDRPKYPPKPVGLAHFDGKDAIYLAWGHPTENNCSEEDGRNYMIELLDNPENEYVCHNTAFDFSIFEEVWDLRMPWERSHDTMLQAFLLDPYGELSLKPLAEKYLGMPPAEQDAVEAWLVRHGICRAGSKTWGAYISKAPGRLVGTYAKGDVIRTYHLHHLFTSKLQRRTMA